MTGKPKSPVEEAAETFAKRRETFLLANDFYAGANPIEVPFWIKTELKLAFEVGIGWLATELEKQSYSIDVDEDGYRSTSVVDVKEIKRLMGEE